MVLFCLFVASAYDLSYFIHEGSVPLDNVRIVLISSSTSYNCVTDVTGNCVLRNVKGSSEVGYYSLSIIKEGYYSKNSNFVYIYQDYNYRFGLGKIPENAWPELYAVENDDVFVRLKMIDPVREYEEYDYFSVEFTLDNIGTKKVDFFDDTFGGVFVKNLNGSYASWGQVPATKKEDTTLSILPGGKMTVTNDKNNINICLTKGLVNYHGKSVTVNTLTCLTEDKSYHRIPNNTAGSYYFYAYMKYSINSVPGMIELDTDSFVVKKSSAETVPPFVEVYSVYINGTQGYMGDEINENDKIEIEVNAKDLDSNSSSLSFEMSSLDFINIDDYSVRYVPDNAYYTHVISWPFLDSFDGERSFEIKVIDSDDLSDSVRVYFDYKREGIVFVSKVPNRSEISASKDYESFFGVLTNKDSVDFEWFVNDSRVGADSSELVYFFNNAGLYEVKVIATDKLTSRSVQNIWIVNVLGDYETFVASKVPDVDSLDVDALDEAEFSFDVSYSYLEPVITWFYDGKTQQSSVFRHCFTCDEVGNNVLKATLSDGITSANYTWDIDVLENLDCDKDINLIVDDISAVQKGDVVSVRLDVTGKYVGYFYVLIGDALVKAYSADGASVRYNIDILDLKDGYNNIVIEIDPYDEIVESSESDNDVTVSVFVDKLSSVNQDADLEILFEYDDIPAKNKFFYGKAIIKNKGSSILKISSVDLICSGTKVENAGRVIDGSSELDAYVKGLCSSAGYNDLVVRVNYENGKEDTVVPVYVVD